MPPVSLVERAELARSRAEQLVALSDVKCFRAWQQIAASQQRLRPHISGGATDPLNEKIRAALLAMTLPPIDGRAWAGKARSGDHRCTCCAAPITAGEPEYEPRDQAGLYAHLACFTAWRDESALLTQGSGASAAGA